MERFSNSSNTWLVVDLLSASIDIAISPPPRPNQDKSAVKRRSPIANQAVINSPCPDPPLPASTPITSLPSVL